MRWLFLAGLSVCMMAANSLLIAASKSSERYSASGVVFATEAAKLVISGIALRFLGFRFRDIAAHYNPSEHILLMLPALLYTVNNNLTFVALDHLSPPLFTLLQNLKILSTALLYMLVMARTLTVTQILALLFLSVGAAVSNYSCEASLRGTLPGVSIVVVQCVLSGLAAVLNELMLKRTAKSDTIHLPNFWLYAYSTIFSWLNFVRENPLTVLPLRPNSIWPWLLVLNGIFNGMLISYITKHLSSLTKVLLSSLAMLLTSLIAALFLNFAPTLVFSLGSVIVLASVYLYHI